MLGIKPVEVSLADMSIVIMALRHSPMHEFRACSTQANCCIKQDEVVRVTQVPRSFSPLGEGADYTAAADQLVNWVD